MPILYEPPGDVGADRILNGVAAFAAYGGPVVVVDFGTATTFDVITGGASTPGASSVPGSGSAPTPSSTGRPACPGWTCAARSG